MDIIALSGINIAYAVASLFLLAAGLSIIFGMMGVINLAHGEFLMLGGFAFVISVNAGIDFWISMFVVAPLVVMAIGMVMERLIVRHLYGRTVETILASWGVSLLLIGVTSETLGYQQLGVSAPLGSVEIGDYRVGGYTFFIIGLAFAVLAFLYAILRWSSFGLKARGTMQSASTAATLGVNVGYVYSATFGLGAAISGLAGAAFAPIAGVTPVSGLTYIGKAFITVIAGGPLPLIGTSTASLLLGFINAAVTAISTPVLGEIALLAAAILLLRLLPAGITGRFFRGGL